MTGDELVNTHGCSEELEIPRAAAGRWWPGLPAARLEATRGALVPGEGCPRRYAGLVGVSLEGRRLESEPGP